MNEITLVFKQDEPNYWSSKTLLGEVYIVFDEYENKKYNTESLAFDLEGEFETFEEAVEFCKTQVNAAFSTLFKNGILKKFKWKQDSTSILNLDIYLYKCTFGYSLTSDDEEFLESMGLYEDTFFETKALAKEALYDRVQKKLSDELV